VPNSVNIGVRGRLETWIGIMVPWGSNLVLVGGAAELEEAAQRLKRVGYDHPKTLEWDAWKASGLPVAKNGQIAPRDLHESMESGSGPLVVDVRLPEEWMGLRVGAVLNLPLNKLAELSAKLEPSGPVVTACNSAYRSSMAVGVLERAGFSNVSNLKGGSQAWIDAGLPVYGAETETSAASSAPAEPKRQVRLPERMGPAELKRLLVDLPGTFDLVDIRPAEQFADYSVPGSRNAQIADVIENPAYLVGAGPLIVADRDGSLAMAVAGILSQKTQRPIKALHGGLEAYWRETEMFGGWSGAAPAMSAPALAPALAPAGSMAPAPAKAEPAPAARPKKRSAGC
jgi:rhodanese-related sulfurtransferase